MGMVVIQPFIMVSKLKRNQDKIPTFYWLAKLRKNPIKKNVLLMLSRTVKRYMRDPVKVYFCLLKIQVKFWINSKLETRLSTYDFSTLYTTLPYNLIKDKFIALLERTFKREGSPHLACNERNAFFTSEKT